MWVLRTKLRSLKDQPSVINYLVISTPIPLSLLLVIMQHSFSVLFSFDLFFIFVDIAQHTLQHFVLLLSSPLSLGPGDIVTSITYTIRETSLLQEFATIPSAVRIPFVITASVSSSNKPCYTCLKLVSAVLVFILFL